MISDSIQVASADVCRRSPLLTVSTLLAATATRYAPLAGLPLMGTSALLIGLDSGVDSATSNLALVSTLLATWLSLGLCLANTAFYTSVCPPTRWVQVAIRVLGSSADNPGAFSLPSGHQENTATPPAVANHKKLAQHRRSSSSHWLSQPD